MTDPEIAMAIAGALVGCWAVPYGVQTVLDFFIRLAG
jgi:hypothetical protein